MHTYTHTCGQAAAASSLSLSSLSNDLRQLEETCCSLRESAACLQSSIAQLEHEREQRKLLALSKVATTQTECGSLTTVDSATQVGGGQTAVHMRMHMHMQIHRRVSPLAPSQ